eukprot:TRINITY_DN144_c0_g1_i7.p1 TRINITY_DN144_c0_g1~~TRINITY_DN144_c0_g1_i7.p1  ORF type:complete len:261 (+),score=56.00 TRINITY_DN144_c0_g1_i7:329-1111(+)
MESEQQNATIQTGSQNPIFFVCCGRNSPIKSLLLLEDLTSFFAYRPFSHIPFHSCLSALTAIARFHGEGWGPQKPGIPVQGYYDFMFGRYSTASVLKRLIRPSMGLIDRLITRRKDMFPDLSNPDSLTVKALYALERDYVSHIRPMCGRLNKIKTVLHGDMHHWNLMFKKMDHDETHSQIQSSTGYFSEESQRKSDELVASVTAVDLSDNACRCTQSAWIRKAAGKIFEFAHTHTHTQQRKQQQQQCFCVETSRHHFAFL